MENSKIEWTHHTFNPWIGCAKVSPGCLHCYAETLMDTRYGRVKWGKGQPRSRTSAENWRKPKRWNKAAKGTEDRPRVFCASLADWLDDEVPIKWLAELLALIHQTPNLDWLLLTKRPQNWLPRINSVGWSLDEKPNDDFRVNGLRAWLSNWLFSKRPPNNVWIGTTVEDQIRADERIPLLLDIPAKVRFLSCEPLLEPVNLRIGPNTIKPFCRDCADDGPLCPNSGLWCGSKGIHWVICGGESGPGARPMHPDWARSLRDQCQAAEVSFFFKQWGGADKKATGRVLDGQTWDALPFFEIE